MARMLEKLTQSGNWEANNKNIQTKGGIFVGYAAKKEDAKAMAVGPALVKFILELHKDNEEILNKLDEILKTV